MSGRKRSSNVSQDLESLKKLWYDKLKNTGFVDLEDENQNLYCPNVRTIAYENQEVIREFFLRLDEYLTSNFNSIKPMHRIVLELYSSGARIKFIADQIKRSRQRVHQIIAQHRKALKNEALI